MGVPNKVDIMKHSPLILRGLVRQKVGRSLKHQYTAHANYKSQIDSSGIASVDRKEAKFQRVHHSRGLNLPILGGVKTCR